MLFVIQKVTKSKKEAPCQKFKAAKTPRLQLRNAFSAGSPFASTSSNVRLKSSAKPADALVAAFQYLLRYAGAAHLTEDRRGCLAYAKGAIWPPNQRCLQLRSMTLLHRNTCHSF
jgi:hypothetical protein